MYGIRTVAKFYSIEISQLKNFKAMLLQNFTVLKQSEYSVNTANCIELCLKSPIRPIGKTNCQYKCDLENNVSDK